MRQKLEKFLECGVPHNGFARIRCQTCGNEYLLPYSCKGRCLCPSCNQRRALEFGETVTGEIIDDSKLSIGVILGSIDIVDIIHFTSSSWIELADQHMDWGDFEPQLIGWKLRFPRKLKDPIPWKGSLGLFNIPDSAIPAEIKDL